MMLHKFSAALAWACLAFIVYATFAPPALRPGLSTNETPPIVVIERVGAFALLGFLFSIAYPEDRSFAVAIVFGSAVLLELLQYIAPGRHARVIDAIEKLVGAGVGVIAARLLTSEI
jgi:VanZ family protein